VSVGWGLLPSGEFVPCVVDQVLEGSKIGAASEPPVSRAVGSDDEHGDGLGEVVVRRRPGGFVLGQDVIALFEEVGDAPASSASGRVRRRPCSMPFSSHV